MGTQPSKLNKPLTRTTTESTTSSTCHSQQCRLHRDQADRPICNHIHNASSLDCSEQGSCQHSDQGQSNISGTYSAGSRSRSNLSSFLSSILGTNTVTAEDTKEGGKDNDNQMMNDLKEQQQQKKVNKMNQKAAKQRRKEQQQQQSPEGTPFLRQSASTTWSSINSAHPPLPSPVSSTHSTAHLPSTTAILEQHTPSRSRAMSTNGVLSSGVAMTPMPSQSSTSLPLNGFTALPRTLNPAPLVPQDPSAAPSSSKMRSIASDDTAPQRLQPQKQKHTKTKKSSFIRGRAGFAWLEKRLPPASMGLDDEMLNNKAWTYQDQERHLDEIEIERAKGYVDRVTDQHYLMKDVMGGNYHVPMDLTFKRVLENGCGAGDWTLDMASEVPEADFVGCPQISFTKPDADPNAASTPSRPRGLLGADQSQQQGSAPGSANAGAGAKTTIRPTIRPRNCNFYPDVPINRIPYSDDHFDFVYQRRQNVVLLANEWDRASSELFRVLKPGGWVQLLEPDLFLQGGGELCQFAGRYCVGMFEGTGRNPNVIHELQPMLEKAGFVNVEIKIYSIPLGWGGVIGEAMLVNQRQFVNEMEPIYVRQGHGSSEQYQGLVGKIFEEIVERKAYINYYVAIGQKPDTNPSPFRGGYDFMNSILKLERCVDDDDDDDDNNNNNNGNDNSDDNKVTMAIESLEISKPQTEPQAVAATELASSSA